VDKDPLDGRIVHSGGLSFSADSESVAVKRFVIDLDRAVLTAKVAGTGQRIALLRLGAPEGAKVGPERIVLRGVDAKLTIQAAKALNEALDTDLFAGGLLIGEATVIAKIGDDHDDGKDRNDDDQRVTLGRFCVVEEAARTGQQGGALLSRDSPALVSLLILPSSNARALLVVANSAQIAFYKVG
jgi:hypothetical protein